MTRWLSGEEQRAWRAWLDAHNRLAGELNRQLQAASALSLADYDVLVALTDVPERTLRMFELGERLQWEKSRLSKQVARMANRGLVRRRECLDDRRGAFVDLTDAGAEAIRSAAPDHVALVRRLVFDGMTLEQVHLLEQVGNSILERLDGEPDR